MLLPGHVIRIYDPNIRPPNYKRHICICPRRRLFLRINSRPLWPPQHQLTLPENSAIIEYESYVELRQLWRFGPSELEHALKRPNNPLGRMTQSEALALAWSARRAETLSEEFQELIWENLVTQWR